MAHQGDATSWACRAHLAKQAWLNKPDFATLALNGWLCPCVRCYAYHIVSVLHFCCNMSFDLLLVQAVHVQQVHNVL